MSNTVYNVVEFIRTPSAARTLAILVLIAAAPVALLSTLAGSLAN
jgi:hypothetical protein